MRRAIKNRSGFSATLEGLATSKCVAGFIRSHVLLASSDVSLEQGRQVHNAGLLDGVFQANDGSELGDGRFPGRLSYSIKIKDFVEEFFLYEEERHRF